MRIFKRNPFARRPGAVYRIRVRGHLGAGYVGKTRQRPYTRRIDQHRRTQPWSDLIVSYDVLWSSPRCSDFHLWWREIYYILTRFPVYNVQWNRIRWNPRRIPPYVAAAQRGKRDGIRHYSSGRMRIR